MYVYIHIYSKYDTRRISKKSCCGLGTYSSSMPSAKFFLFCIFFCRYQEKPQRPWHIFKFDAFKNGFGACVVHFMNIFIAMQFAGKEDPCPWYLFLFSFSFYRHAVRGQGGPCPWYLFLLSFSFSPIALFFFFSLSPPQLSVFGCVCVCAFWGEMAGYLHKHRSFCFFVLVLYTSTSDTSLVLVCVCVCVCIFTVACTPYKHL